MDKYNYAVLYIVLSNFIRAKKYRLVERVPCNWKYKNPPHFVKSIKWSCAYTTCIHCRFLKKDCYGQGDLCIFRYIIDPLRDERG